MCKTFAWVISMHWVNAWFYKLISGAHKVTGRDYTLILHHMSQGKPNASSWLKSIQWEPELCALCSDCLICGREYVVICIDVSDSKYKWSMPLFAELTLDHLTVVFENKLRRLICPLSMQNLWKHINCILNRDTHWQASWWTPRVLDTVSWQLDALGILFGGYSDF